MATMCRKRPTRIRRPPPDRETETLIKLIVGYGMTGKVLKDRNIRDVLESSDQTSLRDKARKMEMDYRIQV